MSEQSKYEGQEYVDGQDAQDVPAMESSQSDASDAGGALRQGMGTGSYARVRMIGKYGAFCSQSQTLDFEDVTLAQARKLKWDYYGACGATLTCYDSQHNVVHEE